MESRPKPEAREMIVEAENSLPPEKVCIFFFSLSNFLNRFFILSCKKNNEGV